MVKQLDWNNIVRQCREKNFSEKINIVRIYLVETGEEKSIHKCLWFVIYIFPNILKETGRM